MLNEREMQIRLERSKGQKVPMTNYGILIAYTHGILKEAWKYSRRSLNCSEEKVLPERFCKLKEFFPIIIGRK